MKDEEPRRFFVAVGVDSYDCDDWPTLEAVPGEVEKIGELLGRFGFTRVLEHASAPAELLNFKTELASWAAAGKDRGDDNERLLTDQLVLYWTGHGEIHSGRLRLILPSTSRDTVEPSLTPEELVEKLIGESARLGPVLLILDVCMAGQGIGNVLERLQSITRDRASAYADPPIAVLCATGSRQGAAPNVFVRAFVDAVDSCSRMARPRDRCLLLEDIARETDRLMLPNQKLQSLLLAAGVPFFRNPGYVADLPPEFDGPRHDDMQHFGPRGRGVADATETGWYFTGRQRAVAELCSWLRRDPPSPGICWVTGHPGVGKSAVLGRLVTAARATYRLHIPPAALAETELPEAGSIDAAVWASKKLFPELIGDICRALTGEGRDVARLVDIIRNRPCPPVLLIDAADESEAPRRVGGELLQQLRGVARVIVGARPPFAHEHRATGDQVIDLGLEPWADADAVSRYVLRLLQKGAVGRGQLARSTADTDRIARLVGEHSNGNFLVARLTALAVLAGEVVNVADPHWHFPRSVGEALDYYLATLGDGERPARAVMSALVFAEGAGLPVGRLWALIAGMVTGQAIDERDIAQHLDSIKVFAVQGVEAGATVYRLFHAALIEHLRPDGSNEEGHARIVGRLREVINRDSEAIDTTVGERAYAQRHITTHLRQACLWRELGDLVRDRSWFDRQTVGGFILNGARYDHDVEETHVAAAIGHVSKEDGPAALGLDVWWLLWKTTVVGLAHELPPEAWAAFVDAHIVDVGVALDWARAVGDEVVRAARLAALAPYVRRDGFPALLDAVALIGDSYRRADVLAAALRGPEAKALVPEALEAAGQLEGSPRRKVLRSLLPLATDVELARARGLAEAMAPDNLVGAWRSRALADHAAELAHRDDFPAAMALLDDQPVGATRGFVVAALLERDRDAGTALARSTVPAELATAAASIKDWLRLAEVQAALFRALPDARDSACRASLVAYLRQLHASTTEKNFNRKGTVFLRCAIVAGEGLPSPHGVRLLRWVGSWLRRSRTRDDPWLWDDIRRQLPVALARQGDADAALDTFESFRQWYPAGDGSAVLREIFSSTRISAAVREDRVHRLYDASLASSSVERLAGIFKWLDGERQRLVLDRFNSVRVSGDAGRVRCAVDLSLVPYTDREQIGNLHHAFVARVAATASPTERNELLTSFAKSCAAAGHAEITLETLAILGQADGERKTWAEVLLAASDRSRPMLLQASANKGCLATALGYLNTTDLLQRFLSSCRGDELSRIERCMPAVNPNEFRSDRDEVIAAVALRHLEVHGGPPYDLLAACEIPVYALKVVSRLPFAARRAAIESVPSLRSPRGEGRASELLEAAMCFLTADESALNSASRRVASALSSFGGWVARSHGWLVDMLPEENRSTVIADWIGSDGGPRDAAFPFEAILRWLDVDHVVHIVEDLRNWTDDDFTRDERIVLLLPRMAEVCGAHMALGLRAQVRRSEFKARSWAVLWRHLQDDQRSRGFSDLTRHDRWEEERRVTAIGHIAEYLTIEQLEAAVDWVIGTGVACDHTTLRLAQSAGRLQAGDQYRFWRAATTAAARRDRESALRHLEAILPVAASLGGAPVLRDIGDAIDRAFTWWP